MSWIFLLVLIILLVRKWKIRQFEQLSSKIKCGIKSYPLIGHAYLFMGSGIHRMNALQRFGRDAIKNGGLSDMWMGGKHLIVSVDAVDLEVILKKALEKGDTTRFVRELTGNGLIFLPVAIWRARRKMLAPAFIPKNLNGFMEVFVRQSNIMVEKLKAVVGKGAVSMWKYFDTLALDSVCETTLDVQLSSQLNSEEPFLKSFEISSKLVAIRTLQPWLHFDALYKLLPCYKVFVKNMKVLTDFIDEAIKFKRKAMKDSKTTKQGFKSLMELLIESSGYSDQELHEDALVMALAGTDTSAVATSFAVSMLARYPRVQEKVVEELIEVFGDSNRMITIEDLPRLKYLEAVIKETLRCYPPAPVLARQIVTDLKLPSGLTLVKGCEVVVNVWAAHRNPLYWGDDAEQFRPERFIEAPLRHPAAFLAFSYGPRNCIGYKYAMMSMKTALATLLRNYRLLHPDSEENNNISIGQEPMTVTFEVMMKDVDGFRVRLEKRTVS